MVAVLLTEADQKEEDVFYFLVCNFKNSSYSLELSHEHQYLSCTMNLMNVSALKIQRNFHKDLLGGLDRRWCLPVIL